MANKPTIIETKTVVVSFHDLDDYGNMIFSDMDGEEYKLAKKREWLHEFIQDERAVTLGYAEYQGHKYIAEASLPADNLPAPTKAKTQPEGDVPVVKTTATAVNKTKKAISDKDKLEQFLKACSFSVSYAKDMIVGKPGEMTADDLLPLASSILDWFKKELKNYL